MSLSLTYQIARSGLSASSTAASVVSRNIAAADDPGASAKSVRLATDLGGGVRVTGIDHAVDAALHEQSLESHSTSSGFAVMRAGLEQLEPIVGDPEAEGSPAALLGRLRDALQLAAGAPHDSSVARSALSAAGELALALNRASEVVAGVRSQAQLDLRDGVKRLNGLLDELRLANHQIKSGTVLGRDTTDLSDRRNAIVRDVAELVDVRVSVRADNEMVLFLASGAVLLETSPRAVILEGLAPPAVGQPGPGLSVDGWPVEAGGTLGGRLGGLMRLRDELSLTFGRQIDEIARGLIVATAESDQSPTPTKPDLAGLFTFAGGPGLPPSSVLADGIAASIRINPSVDPAQGGDIARLRDGGIADPGDPAYVYNLTGGAGFGDRLLDLVDRLSAAQTFDAGAGLGSGSTGLIAFAGESAGWLEQQRASTQSRFEDAQVLAERSLATWQNRVGINIDDEMTTLIALERSYQASSRLITSVNSMFDALLRAAE